MIAPPEAPPEVAIAARLDVQPTAVAELSPTLLHRAARAGIYRAAPELLPFVSARWAHVWWLAGRPVVLHLDRWCWAPPGATYDEIRHAPTCDTEPEALAALLDWLDRPADRRPDWLAGRRPDYLRRRREGES